MRGWSKDEQRGVLQVFNIVMHITTLIAYQATGTLTGEVLVWFGWIAPFIALPAIIGVMVFNRLDVVSFRRMILLLLLISGVTMIAGSVPLFFAA